MAIRQLFKVSRKTFFNPTGWLNYRVLEDQSKTVWDIFRNIFSVTQPARKETFKEAMNRQGLTDKDIDEGAYIYRVYAFFFLFLGILAILYAFYLIIKHGTFAGWLLSIAVSALCLGQAFKFDFWSYQMRKRHLGATFKDWKRDLLGNKDSSV